jgi:arsenite methyltransferase
MSKTQEATPDTANGDALRKQVAARYATLARGVTDADDTGSCCGPTACAPEGNPISADLYTDEQAVTVPQAAVAASLGCGNPTALADLQEGQVVLDLGSGGGIDVMLSARRVGPTGKAYGLDMTDEMLELARKNQREARVENAEFLKGTIEDVPLPDEAVDVIISNCVINLAADKSEVFREAHRVLRPGGRFAVSDIVIRGDLDPKIRESVEAWIGCVAGALEEDEYRSGLEAAGFTGVEIEPTRVYTTDDAREFLEAAGIDVETAQAAEGNVISAFVRATKG